MMIKVLLFLDAFYLGLGSFFSFFVAPTLFKVLETVQAGKVVERIFPVYFAIGFVVSIISAVVGTKVSKAYFMLAIIAALIVGMQLFFLNPYAHSLKGTNYSLFLKIHGLSMALNLLHLLLILILCYLLIKKE